MSMIQMSLLEAAQVAFSTILSPTNFLLIILGVLLGMIMGILPGLGGTVTLALLIPLTYGIDPLVAFMLLAAALGGTNFGGSVTSILLNTPGMATTAATLLDGYPMTQQGRAGEAIGASAMASASGALFGVIVLTASIPIMREAALLFGPPEVFWLGVWGLSVVAVVVKGSVISGLISGGFGLLFSMFGINQMTATFRWTYGIPSLQDGIQLVPALVGVFAVAEMIKLISEGGVIAETTEIGDIQGGQWTGIKAVIEHRWLFLRSAIIGSIIGIIPAAGGVAANYIAYFQAVQTSSDSKSFGTGDIRGVIAAEASNDAKDGTGFIPTLALGIPGSSAMAVLLGAFILHGVQPGPLLLRNNLDLAVTIIMALLVSNILTSLIGVISADQLVKVTKVDVNVLGPSIIAISFMGAFSLRNNIFDLFLTLFFGLLGVGMIYANMSRVPLILGLVLGPIVESNFFRSLQIGGGDYAVFLRSEIAIVLVILVVVSLFLPIIRDRLDDKIDIGGP